MNNKYSGRFDFDFFERQYKDDDDERFVVTMGYSDVGASKNFNEAIEIAKEAFKEEMKKNPKLLYDFDAESENCKRFMVITDLYTGDETLISLAELAKYYIMKKIVGNMK